MVSVAYVKAEVDRAMEQLAQCRDALGKSPADLPTKCISLASGILKSASTLLGVLKDVQPEGDTK